MSLIWFIFHDHGIALGLLVFRNNGVFHESHTRKQRGKLQGKTMRVDMKDEEYSGDLGDELGSAEVAPQGSVLSSGLARVPSPGPFAGIESEGRAYSCSLLHLLCLEKAFQAAFACKDMGWAIYR